jgi:glutamate carboxypeptidase
MSAGNTQETRITDWLASREGDMIALLEKLVNTDSGSYDKAGVDEVADHLRDFLEAKGGCCHVWTALFVQGLI